MQRTISQFILITAIFLCQNINIHAATLAGKTFTSSGCFINSLVSDNNYLWAGTSDQGLLRIDKRSGETVIYTMSNSGLTENCINALAIDKDGVLLIGTSQNGIIRFNGARWERITGLSNNYIRGLTVDNQGGIWAYTQSTGIIRYTTGTWQPVVNRFAGMLTSNPDGNVWLFRVPLSASSKCDDGWIYEYVNGGLQTTISLAPICSEFITPQSFVVDRKKTAWVQGQNALVRINDLLITRFPLNTDTTTHKSISALAVNSNDCILIATTDGYNNCELFLYDQFKTRGQPFDSSIFTSNSSYVTTACPDKITGGFWCAASDGSIIKIDGSMSASVFKTGNSMLPSNTINSLIIDKSNNIWVATTRGIARYNDTMWTKFPSVGDTMPGRNASTITKDSSGTIWAGFQQPLEMSSIQSGIAYFNQGQWHTLKRHYISVKKIAFDNEGDLWIVSEDGVYRYRENEYEQLFKTIFSSVREISLGTTVNTIAFDGANTPWIGTGLGIKRYENGIWIDDTTINPLLPKSEVSPQGVNVNTICFSNDTAWVGTGIGLFKISDGNCTRIDTTGSQLPDRSVQCIAIERPNSIWIGTKRGLVHKTGQKYVTYTTENTPLLDNDITVCAFAPNGVLWVGTRTGGLTYLRQSAVSILPKISESNTGKKPADFFLNTTTNRDLCVSIRTNESADIDFSIYSLQGKLIRRYIAKTTGSQSVQFSWNGTDRSNRPVATGVYLGTVSFNGKIVGSKIVQR